MKKLNMLFELIFAVDTLGITFAAAPSKTYYDVHLNYNRNESYGSLNVLRSVPSPQSSLNFSFNNFYDAQCVVLIYSQYGLTKSSYYFFQGQDLMIQVKCKPNVFSMARICDLFKQDKKIMNITVRYPSLHSNPMFAFSFNQYNRPNPNYFARPSQILLPKVEPRPRLIAPIAIYPPESLGFSEESNTSSTQSESSLKKESSSDKKSKPLLELSSQYNKLESKPLRIEKEKEKEFEEKIDPEKSLKEGVEDIKSKNDTLEYTIEQQQVKIDMQSAKIDEQEAVIAEKDKIITEQKAKIDAQKAEIEKLKKQLKKLKHNASKKLNDSQKEDPEKVE